MLIAKNDEEKRSKLWRFVTVGTTIIILFVTVYFIAKLFTGNPLKGAWTTEDNNLTLIIGDSNLTVRFKELLDETDVIVKMNYTLDKSAKTITLKVDGRSVKEAAEKSNGQFTEQELMSVLETLTTTLDYSLEQDELIMTEREYGEQIVFTKE